MGGALFKSMDVTNISAEDLSQKLPPIVPVKKRGRQPKKITDEPAPGKNLYQIFV